MSIFTANENWFVSSFGLADMKSLAKGHNEGVCFRQQSWVVVENIRTYAEEHSIW